MNFCALRYFNVAGADPEARTGQSTAGATHLIKVAVEAALGKRSHESGVKNHRTDAAKASSGVVVRHKLAPWKIMYVRDEAEAAVCRKISNKGNQGGEIKTKRLGNVYAEVCTHISVCRDEIAVV